MKKPRPQTKASVSAQTIRFHEEDVAILDAVQDAMGFVRRVDALRYVLRQYARTVQR